MTMTRSHWLAFVALAAVCAYVVQAAVPRSTTADTRETVSAAADAVTNARIDFLRAELADHPDVVVVRAQLAEAYLQKAETLHQPEWIGLARQTAMESLKRQESFEGYMAMMHIQDYSHRFEDALVWANKALDAGTNGRAIPDPGIVKSMVEAYLGLGENDKARALLPPDGTEPKRFYTAAAWAQWMNAVGQHRQAAEMYGKAATLALKEGSEPMADWARVAAAGALLDGGDPTEAKAELRAIRGGGAFLQMHRAELAMIEKRYSDALSIYDAAVAGDPDPEIHRLAFVAAKRAGNAEAQARHFKMAETALRHALDLGEVYPLGSLAQLYADAGVHLDEARKLSEENLKWKRDAAAQATYRALHP